MRMQYCVLARFGPEKFLGFLREIKAEGALEVTGIIENKSHQIAGKFVVPFLCSAPSRQDAVDVTATYARDTYPGGLPDEIMIADAPKPALRALKRKDRQLFQSSTAILMEWDGPFEVGEDMGDLDKVSKLAFGTKVKEWETYGPESFLKKKFDRAS